MNHEHDWKRVGPFVVPLGEAYRYGTSETYNAECATCGKRAWLHWPEPRGQVVTRALRPRGR